jgi:hypothetical protein
MDAATNLFWWARGGVIWYWARRVCRYVFEDPGQPVNNVVVVDFISRHPPAAFVVFDGDDFILQVHGVFTCIRSGATTMALYGARAWIYKLLMATVCTSGDSWLDLLGMAAAAWGEKP